MVKKVTVSKDKVVRASAMEPIFEAGNVYFVRGWWNDVVIEQLSQFPNGAHDDHVDSISGGYHQSLDGGSRMILA
jgi:predicted phage terminase large subunit-like protein